MNIEQKLAQILKQHDPVKMAYALRPSEGYAAEAHQVHVYLRQNPVTIPEHATICRILHRVFTDSFSARYAGSEETYREVGRDIHTAWRLWMAEGVIQEF
jgi:hypothetical protein